MIKAKCKTIVFVINNDGYTVERLIWGAQQRKSFFLTPPPSYSYLAIYEKTR
jgi:pyruvate decarboxylase